MDWRKIPELMAGWGLLRSRRPGVISAAQQSLEPDGRQRLDELTRANAELQAQVREREQAQDAVAAERQRFNDILEKLPAYLVLLAPDYHVPFANRFFRERFGESHGRCCFEYLFERAEPCENCESYEALKTNAPHRWQWTGPDGRNYDIYDFPFVDTDGSTLILEMGLDITERQQAQQALQEAHDLLESRVEERTAELSRANAQLEAEVEERRATQEALSESQNALQQAHDELEARVKERTEQLLQTNVHLRAEIEERTRTEQSLKLEEARLDALLHLSQRSSTSLSELAGFVLDQGVALTQSQIGLVGFLNEDESVYTLSAVSKDVVKECNVAGDPLQWHIAQAGLWADAIRQRRTLFINDYSQPHPRKKGLPPGHPYVQKFMVVPLLEGQRVVAVAGVGNKAADYDHSDERHVALLLDGMWKYVQQHRARQALQEAYDELQASEERFRQLAENIHEVFWLLEPDIWRVLYVSPAYDAIWGRSRQELYERPQSFFETIYPEDRDKVLRHFSGNGQAWDREFRILRPDGSLRWIRFRGFPVSNERGQVYRLAGVAVDRTEQKANEAALLQAERLTVAGKIAASLAHEINNPLQSVLGCLGLVQEAVAGGRDPARYLQVAQEEMQRTARIVAQLRSLGRPIQDGNKVATDVNRLIDDLLTLNKKHFQNHEIEVTWEPAGDLPAPELVPDAIRQVFMNLVLNAVDAMPAGGQLRLSTVRTESPAGIRAVVSDTGNGIPPDVLPHIFEPFYSTKEQSMGVGLSVSDSIVRQHGGRIDVESWPSPPLRHAAGGQPATGTTFTVWLPATA